MDHGLSESQLAILKQILSLYADRIRQVDLFGSRATGNYRNNSDIDLVLRGSLTDKHINRLWTLFQDSSLPFRVDVKGYELTTYLPLKSHMDKVCRRLFTQEELKAENPDSND